MNPDVITTEDLTETDAQAIEAIIDGRPGRFAQLEQALAPCRLTPADRLTDKETAHWYWAELDARQWRRESEMRLREARRKFWTPGRRLLMGVALAVLAVGVVMGLRGWM